jgi:beta-fructofuranosidase
MRKITKIDRFTERAIEYLPLTNKGRVAAKHIWRGFRNEELDWDPWLLRDENSYRMFYLSGKNRSILRPWWKLESKIYSAESRDMMHWQNIRVALEPEPRHPWEAGRIFAGSTYKENGIYYLFYSAAGEGDQFLDEGVGLAISEDALNWRRHSSQPLVKPELENPYYAKHGNHFQWRDPYILKDEVSRKYYMFTSAFSKQNAKKSSSQFGGCVGLSVADRIEGPYTLMPPVLVQHLHGIEEPIFYEMERPQVIYKDGLYHLFFSAFVSTLNPQWVNKLGTGQVTDSSLYWYISESISGPFCPAKSIPIVSGSQKTGLYGTNLFSPAEELKQYFAYGWRHRMFSLEAISLYPVNWQSLEPEVKAPDWKVLR